MKTTAIVYTFNLLLVLFASCSKNEDTKSIETADPVITTLTSFDASLMQLPESITLDNSGNIYLSMSPLREIWKLDSKGTFIEVFSSFQLEPGLFGVSGLRFDSNDNLYVAISSMDPDMNGIWKINSGVGKERIAGTGSILLPNDLTVLPNGTIYITDSAMGAIWRFLPGGQAEVWIQHESLEGNGKFGLPAPIGANGIAHISAGMAGTNKAVIVANSEKGQVVKIPVLSDESAGEPVTLIANPDVLFGLDGITIDAKREYIRSR